MRITIGTIKQVDQVATVLCEGYYSSLQKAKQYIKEKNKTKECFVAIDKNKVVGVMIYSRAYSHNANYLEEVIVVKKQRRKGIAKALIKKFVIISKKETPKKQKYTLSSTDITNKASIKMHKKCGFKEVGRIKRLHYGKDEIFFAYKL